MVLTIDELMAAVIGLGRAAHTSRIESVNLEYQPGADENAPGTYRATFRVPKGYENDIPKPAEGVGATTTEALRGLAEVSRGVLAARLGAAREVKARADAAVAKLDELMELADGLVRPPAPVVETPEPPEVVLVTAAAPAVGLCVLDHDNDPGPVVAE